MVVLDTNILIYFFKGLGDVSRRMLMVPPKKIGIPAIVIYELEYGIARSSSPKKRQQQLEELCSLVNVLPFGRPEAALTASIRATLDKKGTPIGPHDLLIAGTALANNATLITRNTKEFSRVPKLQLQNWYGG
ncbi:MAG: type II toxin-antitoxin system VapC family toxin [Pseudohongiella sp.]|uniref:type II toxin-antitoxin system VapC family toxin n=1 Tax=Pseudohongiella sp. TaxID=1979412 RepID=UPI0034A06F4B